MIRERTSGAISVNIYYSFNDFMNRIIEKADELAHQNHNRVLAELFNVSLTTYEATTALIGKGWNNFLALANLFKLSYFGFAIALDAFLSTPLGILIITYWHMRTPGILGTMYKEKIFPLAVYEVGEHYKVCWENADGNPNIIDNLLNEAANDLYRKVLQQARE